MNTNRLISLRENLKMTQVEMAKVVGVKRSTYAGWETKVDTIPLEHLNNISNIYDISLDYLTYISDNNDTNFKHIELNSVDVGKRLREARIEAGLTQKKVADLLGTGQSTISSYEKGNTLILLLFLIKFAKITNKSIDYLCCKID